MISSKDKDSAGHEFDIRLLSIIGLFFLAVMLAVVLNYLHPILQPFLIAVFLFLLINPLVEFFAPYNISEFTVYFVVLILLISVSLTIGVIVYSDLHLIKQNFPKYEENLNQYINKILEMIGRDKVRIDWQVYLSHELFRDIPLAEIMSFVFGTVMSFLGNFLLMCVYLVFIISEANKLPRRVRWAFTEKTADKILQGARRVGKGVQSYLLIKTTVSFLTAMVSGVVMFLFNLEQWFLWAVFIFLLNYIPYIGSIAAASIPILFGFLQFPSPMSALIMAFLLTITQIIMGNFIEPYFSGKKLQISPLVLLLFTAYWGWLWGVLGMILAYPFVITLKSVLDSIDRTAPLAKLMTDD